VEQTFPKMRKRPHGQPRQLPNDSPSHLLVPTDFSDLANRAIPVGYGLAGSGGVVHLLHVITRKPGEGDVEPTERLRALIPLGASARGIATEIEIVREEDASTAISHAAGRSGVSRVVMGSQAQEVMQRSRQPVILVPPERDG